MNANKKMQKIKLIAGRSNPRLSQNISNKMNIPLVKINFQDFGNGEIGIEILESIREFHVYIIQTGANNETHSINDYIIELIAIVDACRRSGAKTITVILPFYMYSRGDKKDAPRVPIMGATIAHIFKSLGVTRIVAMDLHAGQIQGFTDIPFDNLYGNKLLTAKLNSVMDELSVNEYTLGSPDVGGAKRVESGYAKKINKPFIILHKHRDYSKVNTVIDSVLIGKREDVEGKIIVLIDDMFDTFGTIQAAATELKKKGAIGVIAVATHGVFSGPAIQRINESDDILKVIVTNSLPQEDNLTKVKNNKLLVVDISDFIAEVIFNLRTGGSVSSLF